MGLRNGVPTGLINNHPVSSQHGTAYTHDDHDLEAVLGQEDMMPASQCEKDCGRCYDLEDVAVLSLHF